MLSKELLRDLFRENRYENRFLSLFVHSAPLLKGVKASHIMNVDQKDLEQISKVYAAYGIEYKVLSMKGKRAVLFLYHREKLERYLFQEKCLKFLLVCGYQPDVFDGLLEQFGKRMQSYQNQRNDFPHEMGIFLEYPVDDVEAFIVCKGGAYLFCGYWKVYTNPQKAREIFKEYDEAKDEMVYQIAQWA